VTTPGTVEQRAPEAPPPRVGFGRRCVRTLLAPARFARRRPARAALYGFLLVLGAAVATAFGFWLWFGHHLRLARVEAAQGHNAAALRHLRKCQFVNPEAREVLLLTARVVRRSGEFDEADAVLTLAEERYGSDEEVVLERLALQAVRGDVEGVGRQLLVRSRAGGPDAPVAREALVTGLLYRFRWPEAYRLLEEWRAAAPDSTAAILLLGKLEEQRQGVETAIAHYRRVVELDPEHDEARMRLVGQLLAANRGDEALPHAQVLRGRLPDHAEVAVQWARVLALEGRTDESGAALAACLQAHPNYPAALVEAGAQAMRHGDEAAAAQYFAEALKLDPGDPIARDQYAFALARTGKTREAARARAEADRLKADLERITVLIGGAPQERPNDPNIHYEIAQIALRSGQVREALRWFTSALQVDPNHAPTHQALAAVYHELGKPGLAARHRALAHRPGDPLPKQ
jgi:Flp pilus assembly protein TadD